MFKEIHNHEDAEYHSVGDKDLNEYTQFSEISPSDYEEQRNLNLITQNL